MTAGTRPLSRPRPRLLVLRTLREGCRLLLRHRRELAIAGAIPCAISTCIALVLSLVNRGPRDIGTDLVVGAISALPLIAFEIGWYRRVLVDQAMSWRDLFTWSPVHTVFVAWNVAASAALSLHSVMAPPFEPIAFFLVHYVMTRLSFILPSAAAGEVVLFSLAWERSENNGWRLLLLDMLAILLPLVALLPMIIPMHMLSLPTATPVQLLAFLWIALRTATTALSFQALVEHGTLNAPRAH